MPYIDQKRRDELDPYLSHLASKARGPGELNYCFTYLIRAWRKKWDASKYDLFNATWGALIGALLEDVRTQGAPYENAKRRANGDVDTDPRDTAGRGW